MIKTNREPSYECPSYRTCSANQCPLDPDMLKRFSLPGEADCRTRRSIRTMIAARFPDLPTGGLNKAEMARDVRRALAKKRWEAMTPEERARRLAKLTPYSAKHAPPCDS